MILEHWNSEMLVATMHDASHQLKRKLTNRSHKKKHVYASLACKLIYAVYIYSINKYTVYYPINGIFLLNRELYSTVKIFLID